MADSKPKLHYFQGKGLGEVARLICTIKDVEFEDIRYNDTTWPEAKSKMPLEVMPVLDTKEGMYGQSNAINRYLAREYGVYGNGNFEAFKIDEVCETVRDIFNDLVPIYYEKDEAKKNALIDTAVKEKMPKNVAFLERRLSENAGGDGWFVGNSISLADIQVYHGFSLAMGMMTVEKFSILLTDKEKLKAHRGRFEAFPQVAEWLKKYPNTP